MRRTPALTRFTVVTAAACAISMIGVAGCASAQPYNPSGLPSGQLSQVAGICQSTMGLSPSEPPRPVWGAATNPDLTGGENYYEGCIASLSDYQKAVNDGYAAVDADRDCRGQGYVSGTPGLAECVLRTERTARPVDRAAGATPVSQPAPVGSYYSAGNRDENQRIEMACARLGLNPTYAAFAGCVKNMKDTFYSIDNPQN
jgi:hypothetical protein